MKAKLIATLMIFLAGALPGMATPHCAAPVVQKQVQAVEVVYPAVAVQQVQVVVPVYGLIQYPAAYYAPQQFAAPLQEESRLDRIERLLLQMVEGRAMPLQAPKAASCSDCHSGKTDAPKMDFSALTPQQKALSAKRIFDGTMPPKSRLSDQEKTTIVAEVVK